MNLKNKFRASIWYRKLQYVWWHRPRGYKYKPKLLLRYIYLSVRKIFKPEFVRNGVTYTINNPRDSVEHQLYFYEDHDNRKYMLSKIKTGMTVLDVGSNIGDTVCNIAHKIGASGFVYGFEPCKETFLICTQTIELNKICNSEIYNFGFSNKPEEQNLYINPYNRGANHISIIGTEKIILKTLDDWVENYSIASGKIDFIKIDVEGYEYKVLQGGEKTLKKYSPELFFEIDLNFLKRNSTSWDQVFDFLESLGYECINSETGVRVGREWGNNKTHIDIYASKK